MSATQVAERYRLERLLGAGAMARVHLARDTVLDREVVVKVLTAPGDDLRARFLREGRLAASLAHPNVVRVYDTGEDENGPYLVMEHVRGESLAGLLRRRGPLPAAEVAVLGAQACAGLARAHDAGIVHRDVKPQNLLLRDDGTLKVADFGLARGAGNAAITEAGTILGTAGYIAPELARGEVATAAADLFSLGAVLYELLTGRPPREAATLAEIDLDRPVPPVQELAPATPDALACAVTRCLEPHPRRRPGSAAALALELEAVSGEEQRATAPTRSLRPERDRLRRPRWRAWPLLAAGAAAALVAAALWLTLDGGGSPEPAPVDAVPTGASPAETARNLSRWLRENGDGPR